MAAISRRLFTAGLLASCAPRPRGRDGTIDVAVVGAGLSGLFAAMTLAEAGVAVRVFERENRVGGRMWTLDDLPGRPEAGGAQVGRTYARVRYAAAKAGVAVIDPATAEREDRIIHLGGAVISPTAWAGATANPFPAAFRAAPPDSVLFAAAAPANPFAAPGDWRAARSDVSAEAFLERIGFDAAARRLVDIALNANRLADYSMVNVWRTLRIFAEDAALGPSGDIEGGSQRLPEAMARALGEDAFVTGAAVRRVEADEAGVTVRFDDGFVRARHCILAAPFPALRSIAIDPAPSGVQAEAIAGLAYTQIVQLHLAPDTDFWTRDGLPPAMWTDGPLERIFAVKANGATVGLVAWINGDGATALDLRNDAALEALAQTEMKRLRPASEGKVRLLKAVRWTRRSSTAGGAYMHFAPGQVARWAGAMGAPLGRLRFAGEHLSHLHTGMEGACESGHAAALSILSELGR